jgi:hypothetical protein
MAMAGLVVSATVGAAAAPGDAFSVSPGEGGPFTVVDVSGADCLEGSAPSVAGTVVGAPEIGVVTQFTATPDENGDWAATFTVPPNKPAGQYQVTATCTTDPDQPSGADYAHQPFTILAGEAGTMTVSPLTARAGADVTVTASGTLCRGDDPAVDVGIFVRVPEDVGDADEFVARTTAVPDDQGNWTTQLTIPATAGPGTYGLSAQCIIAGVQFFLYKPIDVTLSPTPAPPATPLPDQPTFTG